MSRRSPTEVQDLVLLSFQTNTKKQLTVITNIMLYMYMPTSKILFEKNMQVKINKLPQITAIKLHTQLLTQSLHLPS